MVSADMTVSAFLRTDINLVECLADLADCHRPPAGGGGVAVDLSPGLCGKCLPQLHANSPATPRKSPLAAVESPSS